MIVVMMQEARGLCRFYIDAPCPQDAPPQAQARQAAYRRPSLFALSSSCPSIVKGDQKVASMAAASILAKTYRDGLLHAPENLHAGYG